ncbi:MAG: ATP-grasp domain-containing protein [Bacteroidia bacterium]
MKKIAIIGASYLQLPLVRKAKELGIETHCFAWEEGAVCKKNADFFYPISIIDKEKILELCQQIGIDGITSIASDAAVPTICYVAEEMGLIGNLYIDALVATDKYQMRQRFSENNVRSPRFVIADDNYSIENFQFPLIVKPTDRSGSRGVLKIENELDLKDAVARAKKESFSNQAIIEEYITGSEVSVETITWQGTHYILAITDKVTTGEPYFVELEHHQPSQLSTDIQDKIKSETIKALNALNINYGASHSEFKITNKGEVYAIEVGARMGGDFIGSNLVQLSTGYDFVSGVIDVSLGSFTPPVLDDMKYSGVYFLCEETRKILPIIQNANNYKEIVEAETTNNELVSIQCSADRSGYFIYQSDIKFNTSI